MPAPKDFPEMWAWLKAEVKKAKEGSSFSGTGMHPNGQGGIDSDNFDDTHGFSFKDTGDAEFNGNVDVGGTLNVTGNTVIGGTLSLPNGIIDNDALANPLQPSTAHADATNFSVPGRPSTNLIMSVTVPVPPGFTQALILSLVVNAKAFNTTASPDNLYINAVIPGQPVPPGYQISSADAPGSAYAVVEQTTTRLLTGLSGSFTIQGKVMAELGAWSADVGNAANIDAAIVFLR